MTVNFFVLYVVIRPYVILHEVKIRNQPNYNNTVNIKQWSDQGNITSLLSHSVWSKTAHGETFRWLLDYFRR